MFSDDFYGQILCMTVDKLSVIMVLIVDKVYCGEMILFVFRLKCFYNIEYSDTMEKQTISFYAFFEAVVSEDTKT